MIGRKRKKIELLGSFEQFKESKKRPVEPATSQLNMDTGFVDNLRNVPTPMMGTITGAGFGVDPKTGQPTVTSLNITPAPKDKDAKMNKK